MMTFNDLARNAGRARLAIVLIEDGRPTVFANLDDPGLRAVFGDALVELRSANAEVQSEFFPDSEEGEE